MLITKAIVLAIKISYTISISMQCTHIFLIKVLIKFKIPYLSNKCSSKLALEFLVIMGV